jgi:hypothetical protein
MLSRQFFTEASEKAVPLGGTFQGGRFLNPGRRPV